jgi:ketosteroid isomerase-like protein
MADRDEFLNWVQERLIPAERALHDGDAGPRFAIWSSTEPVTIMGAGFGKRNAIGPEEIRRTFEQLEAMFSDCRSYSLELLEVDVVGDAAYTVAFEHVQTSMGGEPRSFTLRATQVYRREGGEWKACHRHADTLTEGERG